MIHQTFRPLVGDPVVDILRVPAGRNDPGFPKLGQLLREGGLVQAEVSLEIAYGSLSAHQVFGYSQASRMSEPLQEIDRGNDLFAVW